MSSQIGDVDAMALLASCLIKTGRGEQAEALLNEAIRLDQVIANHGPVERGYISSLIGLLRPCLTLRRLQNAIQGDLTC